MTQDEILELIRQHANTLANQAQAPMLNDIILRLARLLSESRGKLSKEDFNTLIHIGSVLYREGDSQFQARTDINAIMKNSLKN